MLLTNLSNSYKADISSKYLLLLKVRIVMLKKLLTFLELQMNQAQTIQYIRVSGHVNYKHSMQCCVLMLSKLSIFQFDKQIVNRHMYVVNFCMLAYTSDLE